MTKRLYWMIIWDKIDYCNNTGDDTNIKEINRKLKELKISYYKQDVVKNLRAFGVLVSLTIQLVTFQKM